MDWIDVRVDIETPPSDAAAVETRSAVMLISPAGVLFQPLMYITRPTSLNNYVTEPLPYPVGEAATVPVAEITVIIQEAILSTITPTTRILFPLWTVAIMQMKQNGVLSLTHNLATGICCS